MASLIIRGLSLIPKAFQFIKPYIPQVVSGISKGLKFVGGLSSKIVDIGSKIATGIEVAKQIPDIGQKIREIDEGSGTSKFLRGFNNSVGKIGKVSHGIDSLLASNFVG